MRIIVTEEQFKNVLDRYIMSEQQLPELTQKNFDMVSNQRVQNVANVINSLVDKTVKVINDKNSKLNGMMWGEYVKRYKISPQEVASANNLNKSKVVQGKPVQVNKVSGVSRQSGTTVNKVAGVVKQSGVTVSEQYDFNRSQFYNRPDSTYVAKNYINPQFNQPVQQSQPQLTAKQIEASNAGWGPVTDDYAKSLPVGKDGKILPKVASAPVKTAAPVKKPVQIPIPKELKDAEGVKKFQIWLDDNYPGWHPKYKTLNGDVNKGFGRFGPNTSRSWASYGKQYLENPEPAVLKKMDQPVQKMEKISQDPKQPEMKLVGTEKLANLKNTISQMQTAPAGGEIYKILYSDNRIRTADLNKNILVVNNKDNILSTDDHKKNLDTYMTSIGYENIGQQNDGDIRYKRIVTVPVPQTTT